MSVMDGLGVFFFLYGVVVELVGTADLKFAAPQGA